MTEPKEPRLQQTQPGTPDHAGVEAALAGLVDSTSGQALLDIARVESLATSGGRLTVVLAVPPDMASRLEPLLLNAQDRLESAYPGWATRVTMTAHRAGQTAPSRPPSSRPASAGHRPLGGVGRPDAAPEERPLGNVGTVIAVASGKGGVGKSTTAVNLAVGLAMEGLSVGLMDADVHGPSLPRMLGVSGKPEVRDGRLIPVRAWGISAMSIGMLVDETQAMIWRGPMVMGAIGQLLGDVEWGALDVLVIDMPPGTGDAQLTLAQKAVLTGAIVVSTPQDIALLDARRGIAMFEKTRVPVLGLVENMSYFCCPNCGHRTELFGHGGAREEAGRVGVPFLGEIPLLADIRMSADAGAPIVAGAPDSEAARAYRALSSTVAETVRRHGARRTPAS